MKFALGLAVGILAGAGVTGYLVAAKYQARIAKLNDDWHTQLVGEQQKAEATITERVEHCQSTIAELQTWNAARTADAAKNLEWYTVLYEDQVEAPAPQQQTSTVELLNIVRPGLGTAIAKLQAPRAAGGVHYLVPKWVIPGQVHPISSPDRGFALPTKFQPQ